MGSGCSTEAERGLIINKSWVQMPPGARLFSLLVLSPFFSYVAYKRFYVEVQLYSTTALLMCPLTWLAVHLIAN